MQQKLTRKCIPKNLGPGKCNPMQAKMQKMRSSRICIFFCIFFRIFFRICFASFFWHCFRMFLHFPRVFAISEFLFCIFLHFLIAFFFIFYSSSWFARISSSAYQIDLRPPFLGIPGDWLPKSIQSSERKNPQMGSEQVCFSGSVLLESFDIEVVSYDGNLSRKSGRSHALKHTEDPDPGC